MWSVNDPDSGKPRYEKFGGVDVFRPGWTATIALRNEAEEHFRARFKPGTYVGRDAINKILQHHFSFYAGKLSSILPYIASRDYLEFVLFQYDKSAEVDRIAKAGRLSEQQEFQWTRTGPALRRALKYQAERVVMLSPDSSARAQNPKTMLLNAEQALICAEQLTELYIQSDKVFSIYPDAASLEVLPEGELEMFRCRCENDHSEDMVLRIRRDMKHRTDFMPVLPPQMTLEGQDEFLADAFRQTIGITLNESLGVIRAVVDHAQTPTTGFKIPFCSHESIVSEITRHSGFPRVSVQRALAGFTVTKAGLESEGREIFKPKQEYRAYRRGFFEMPHSTGPHLAWSGNMAMENAVLLLTETPLKQIPAEWNSPAVVSALGRLSNAIGKWFESAVAANFKRLGILGVQSVKDAIGRGPSALPIPQDIGEIDFVGYSPHDSALVVAECKFVRSGTEPKFDRDDIKDFVTGTNAFMKRLKRKTGWILENLPAVRSALSDMTGSTIGADVRRVFSVMVTYYPSSATYFWKDAPCVSLTELMIDYHSHGEWPFRNGVSVVA
jgi:hypothetical protein